MILLTALGACQVDSVGHTYYTAPARNAPIMVTIDRSGAGKVWNVARAPRLVSTFRIESVVARLPYSDVAYTAISSPLGDRAMIVEPDLVRFRVVRLAPFKELWRSAEGLDQLTQSIWSEDGRFLIVPNRDSRRASTVYRASDGKRLGRIPIADPLVAGKGRVYGLAGTFAHGGLAGVELRNRRTTLRIDEPTVESAILGLSPDGRYLVSAGRDRSRSPFRYRVWRTADGRKTADFAGQGRSRNHPLDPLFLDARRFALLRLGEIRRLPDGRLLRRFPSVDAVGVEGVYLRDPAHPLQPRYVKP